MQCKIGSPFERLQHSSLRLQDSGLCLQDSGLRTLLTIKVDRKRIFDFSQCRCDFVGILTVSLLLRRKVVS